MPDGVPAPFRDMPDGKIGLAIILTSWYPDLAMKCPYCRIDKYTAEQFEGWINCPTCRAKKTAWRRAHPISQEYAREQRLLREYGITSAMYEQMVAKQNGKCAICGKRPNYKGMHSRLHVDHNHSTGQVRELLCNTCNGMFGYYEKHKNLLARCEEYEQKHHNQNRSMSTVRASLGDEKADSASTLFSLPITVLEYSPFDA